MPAPPFVVPPPILDWIRNVFAKVSRRSAATLSRIPTTYETTLDQSIIAHLSDFSAPFKFPSDWIVTLDTHYLGGGRYWGNWEIADIGILAIFRRKAEVLGSKIALLQSKRLYPDEIEIATDMHAIDYLVGFGRLFPSKGEYSSHVKQRVFHFSPSSKYRALAYQEEQYRAILQYGRKHGIPVHYLLHNPLDIPCTAVLPANAEMTGDQTIARVACRVIKAETLDIKLGKTSLMETRHPSFTQVAGHSERFDGDFWTLDNFVADRVIGCQEGYIAGTNPTQDEGLLRVFTRRSGPISAAISITIDAPATD